MPASVPLDDPFFSGYLSFLPSSSITSPSSPLSSLHTFMFRPFFFISSLSLSFSKWPPLPLALVLPLSLLPSLCHLFLTLKSKSDALIRTFRNTLSWNVSPCTSTRPAGPSPLLPVPPVASSAFLSKPFFLSWIKCLKASQGTFICTAQFRHEATQLEIASVKRQ